MAQLVFGKRQGPTLTKASVASQVSSSLLFGTDRHTKVCYLVNAGAETCVVFPLDIRFIPGKDNTVDALSRTVLSAIQ